MTKDELKNQFYDGRIVNAALMGVLIDNLKGVQSPVSDPSASGNSVTFIATITQNAEGVITITKKTVDFSGYQTVAGMASYQIDDVQVVDRITVGANQTQTINHNKKHLPTVRLIDDSGVEVFPTEYQVTHTNEFSLRITLGGALTGTYMYILD